MERLVNFFGCGYVANYTNRPVCEFIVTKIDHIVKYIIPFFRKTSNRGVKVLKLLRF